MGDDLQKQVDELRDRLAALLRSHRRIVREFAKRENELDSEISRLRDDLAQAKEHANNQAMRIDGLDSHAVWLQREHDERDQAVTQLGGMIADRDAKIDTLQADLAQTKRALEAVRAKRDYLKNQCRFVKRLNCERDQLKADSTQLTHALRRKRIKIDKLQTKCRGLENLVANRGTEIKELKDELKAERQATSWLRHTKKKLEEALADNDALASVQPSTRIRLTPFSAGDAMVAVWAPVGGKGWAAYKRLGQLHSTQIDLPGIVNRLEAHGECWCVLTLEQGDDE